MFKENGNPGPLDGVKVLDLTIALAGPLATTRMGDLGAEVIKVESPIGDFSRIWPLAGYRHGGESSAFLSLNRSKKSISIDLKSEKGLEILYILVKEADIFVQNFRPRVANKLKIDYKTLQEINPKLVYISISGYGDTGPMADRPGQDLLVQSFSGLTFNAGKKDGMPHPSPVYAIDVCASHLAVQAALSGYIEAIRTGKGQHMKVSMVRAAMELQIQEITTFLTSGQRAHRSQRNFVSTWMEPPYNIYKTKDNWIAIAQATFSAVAEVFNLPEIAEVGSQRPNISEQEAYLAWRDKIYDLVSEKFLENTTDYWIEKMTEVGIWVGSVRTYEDIVADPYMEELFMEIVHPKGGVYKTLAPAIDCENVPNITPSPHLGEHTKEVLKNLGYTDDAIASLQREEVIK